MILPIDGRRAPFKPKYIEDETTLLNKWMVFGHDSSDDTVHVSDAEIDIFHGLTPEQAKRIVDARKLFVDTLLIVLNGGV